MQLQLYKKESLLMLLNPATITAIKNIYGLSLKHLSLKLNLTPQAVSYILLNDCLKDWQKEKILDLYISHGLEVSELIFVHTMITKRGTTYATN